MQPTIFSVKKNRRLTLSVASAEAILGAMLLLTNEPIRWAGLGCIAVSIILVWWAWSSFCVIDDTNLVVRSGPLRWKTPLHEIDEIEPWSITDKSLNGLLVTSYGSDGSFELMTVWPADKEGFLEAIAAKALGLEFDGQRVKRR